jgi:hypothetical protein
MMLNKDLRAMEARRDAHSVRSASVIESRQASGHAARDRALARNVARQTSAVDQWRRAVREGR